MRTSWKIGLVASILAAASFGFSPAQANVVSQFTVANVPTGTDLPPFGTVTISCSSSTSCTINFQASGDNVFFDTNAFDVNLNSGVTGVSFDQATSVGSFGAVTVSTGSFQNDGFGLFNTQVNIFDGPNSGVSGSDILELSVTGSGLTSSNLLVFNAKNFDASGHVFSPTLGSSCTFKVGEGTGSVTSSTTKCESVPEPASLVIFGSALASFGLIPLFRRRRRDEA